MRIKPAKFVVTAFGWLAALVCGPASAVYVFTSIDYPGAVFTDVRGINNTGQIVGYTSTNNINDFSFVYNHGLFTALPAPLGGLQAAALGVNDSGVVVGGVLPANATSCCAGEQGFMFIGGVYSLFSHPGFAVTEARGISNTGLVTGWATNPGPGGTGFGSGVGFIYSPSTQIFTDFAVPGFPVTLAQGINLAGQVVGNSYNTDGSGNIFGGTGYLRQSDGTIVPFNIGGVATRARGINDNGLITGFVGGAVQQAFVGNSSGFQFLGDRGAEGINNAGQIVGLYNDASGNTHGFLATPAILPSGTNSNGAYTFDTSVVGGAPIFIDPLVAVGYDYAIGLGDPLFASVSLPIGIGDSLYMLSVGGQSFALAGGDLFDFLSHGFPNGVDAFEVTGIEVSAGLDPGNSQAFPTELTFVGSGQFTGTMRPITVSVPEPGTLALMIAAMFGLAWCSRWRLHAKLSSAPNR